jgi:hypothetical protein
VEFEGNLIQNLLGFSEKELNTLGEAFEGENLAPFFIGSKWEILKASLKFLFNRKVIKNWRLVQKLFK